MNTSALRARVAAAAQRFADELVDAIENASSLPEWVDQDASPLGRRRHLELVRAGAFPGAKKDGKNVLVHRGDIEAYLAERPALTGEQETGEKSAEDAAAEALGLKRVKGGR